MSVQTIVSNSQNTATNHWYRSWWSIILTVLAIIVALAIAYQPVMFNFFTSDDFYIISWLDSIKHNPLLLFQGIYEGTPYYRPFANLFWFGEYIACGLNSPLFRLIALAIETLSAAVLGFILVELATITKTKIANFEWPLFTAALFLLWPLHTEPVNWFVSDTEVLVNLFILCAFWFYLRWRISEKLSAATISCAFAICAFLTKETAAALPILLLAYELVFSRSFLAIKRTAPYWVLLASYLFIRKFITGSFLGTWGNSVFYFSGPIVMVKAWLQSLKTMLVPLSSAIFTGQLFIYGAWISMIIALIALSIGSFSKDRNRIALGTFIALWFVISLIPMLKLLLITPDLLNARYGFIASGPLCALLMFGLANIPQVKWRYCLFALVLTFSCFMLRSNNLAWAQAGQFTNDLRQEFIRIHQTIAGDPTIYFANIPVRYKGVPINGIKTIQSMNHSPFSAQNFDHGAWLNQFEKAEINAYFFYWNMQDRHFHPSAQKATK